MFKVVLLGEVGVGKTSLFFRLRDNVFNPHIKTTTGIDSCSRTLIVGDVHVTVSVGVRFRFYSGLLGLHGHVEVSIGLFYCLLYM
jgi:hypothetical protein